MSIVKKFCLFLLPVVLGMYISTPANAADTTSGTVVEKMDAGNYTYMRVDAGSRMQWVAIPQTDISIGDPVTYRQGMVMTDFHSKILDKNFASIVFSPGLATSGKAGSDVVPTDDSFAAAVQAERQTGPQQVAPSQTSAGSIGAVVPFNDQLVVEKAAGTNGYTVAEIYDRVDDLAGKKIRVRGRVMKFNAMIMGRNWVHLQDGTGDPMHNTHDLVVTTTATIAPDSIVTLEGILAADKDFGAGYKYAALIENAEPVDTK